MRKMKKINGYLVVRFNDREKREYEDTGLGSFGVIDAELYTGILDVDRSVMEYDDAETLEIAMEQARGLEAELDVEEPETKITVIVESETEISEGEVEPERLFRERKALLEARLQSGQCAGLDPRTAAHELYGYTRALEDLGMIDGHDERFMVEQNIFGATTPPLASERWEEALDYICDELCKYREGRTQEELDIICEKCKLGRRAADPPTLTPQEVREPRNLRRLLDEVHNWNAPPERGAWRLEMKLPEGVTLKAIQGAVNAVRNDEPPRENFRHLPGTGDGFLARKVYQLGLAMEIGCPNNDCTIYRNTYRIARELDEVLDGAQGCAAEVLQRELGKRVRELWRMYYENHAVKALRKGVQL